MPAFGLGNLCQVSPGALKVERYSTFSSSISASLTSFPGTTPLGLSVDTAPNLLAQDDGGAKHVWKFSGFSTSITASFVSPSGTPNDITFDNTNVYSSDQGAANKVFKLNGFSSSVLASFTNAANNEAAGISLDGTSFYEMDQGTGNHKLKRHTLFQSSINNSFASAASLPRGIAWDAADTTGNVLQSNITGTKNYKMSGFTSSIISSFVGVISGDNYGMEWDAFYGTVAPGPAPGPTITYAGQYRNSWW